MESMEWKQKTIMCIAIEKLIDMNNKNNAKIMEQLIQIKNHFG